MSAPPAGGPIRVLVADDHRVVRQGLRGFLATTGDIRVVGEASDGSETLTQLHALADRGEAPDVVLMDLLMSPMDGIEATRQIRARYPQVQVVALTSFVEEEKAHAALDAGASGFLLKDADADEVAAAIRAAYRGEPCTWTLPSRPPPLQALRAPGAPRPGAELTGREHQVLRLVAARQGQQGHRRRAQHQRAHRPHPRQQHPHQAAPDLPHPGGVVGVPRGPRPSRGIARRAAGQQVK